MLIGCLGGPVSAEVQVKDVYTACASRGEAESVNGIRKEQGPGVRNLLTVKPDWHRVCTEEARLLREVISGA